MRSLLVCKYVASLFISEAYRQFDILIIPLSELRMRNGGEHVFLCKSIGTCVCA